MSCGGDLRLFFNTEDPTDYDPTRPALPWKGTDRIDAQIGLPGGNTLNLMLEVNFQGSPQTFFLFATMSVQDPNGQPIVPGAAPIGQGTIVFVKGQPALTFWKGWTGVHEIDGYRSDAGFVMTVPFDGTSADCHGYWWVKWSPIAQS